MAGVILSILWEEKTYKSAGKGISLPRTSLSPVAAGEIGTRLPVGGTTSPSSHHRPLDPDL